MFLAHVIGQVKSPVGRVSSPRAKLLEFKGGGGGGVHPDYFVKLDFEIAVEQQTRARDRTFEGIPDSG